MKEIRQEKETPTCVHKYYTVGSRIHEEKRGDKTLYYYYDATGIAGMKYNDGKYYFQKNIQGDVVRIFNEAGMLQASYVYGAWGEHRVLNPYGTENTSETFIGNINPFRYRGYYYDAETGLFLVSSRYYDPETGRFISPDSIEYLDPSTIGGLNLYAYCGNDPVNRYDTIRLDIFGKLFSTLVLQYGV